MNVRNITVQSHDLNPADGTNSNHACSLAVSERNHLLRTGQEKIYTLNVSTEKGVVGCPYYDTGRKSNRYFIKVDYNWMGNGTINHRVDGELLVAVPERIK